MAGPYRMNSMMAMLDAKPEAKGMGKTGHAAHGTDQQRFWNDASDNQSPLRKHLISTYMHVPDEEAMPLLGEYFGVALSFVALGALVRASNSSKKKHSRKIVAADEERLDLRACSKLERMALESMLKESMERLGSLSLSSYQLQSRVRDLVDENVAQDKEKVHLLERLAGAEKLVVELRALRRAEGRANERVMSIVAGKEQDWLKEKRNFQKEIEKLKDTVSGMTREAKFQASRCRNPACDHCKGLDRVVRNVKGRISLRELQSLREASEAPVKRVASPPKVVELQEIEETQVLMKALELKRKQRELRKVDTFQQVGGTGNDATQSGSKELLVKQQQDMESELANILKRVGMLKQKSFIGGSPSPSTSKDVTEEVDLSMNMSDELVDYPDDGIAVHQIAREGVERALVLPKTNTHDSTLEPGNCGSQEESDLVELEKAFELSDEEDIEQAFDLRDVEELETTLELRGSQEVEKVFELVDDDELEEAFELRNDPEVYATGEDLRSVSVKDVEDDFKTGQGSEELVENTIREDGGESNATNNEHQADLDVDDELFALEQSLSLGDKVDLPEVEVESNEGLAELSGQSAGEESAVVEPADVFEEGERGSAEQVLEHTPEATTADMVHTENVTEEVDERSDEPQSGINLDAEEVDVQSDEPQEGGDVQSDDSQNGVSTDAGGLNVAEKAAEDEQVLGVIEDNEDAVEFSDASSSPLDFFSFVTPEERISSAGFLAEQAEQDHIEFESDMDVNETHVGFKDPASNLDGDLLENQDIPVFERNSSDDDSAGELPELEEKRVCGPPETLDSAEGSPARELSSLLEEMSQEDGELLKDKGRGTSEKVGSQQDEDDAFVETTGLDAADEKPKSDAVVEHSEDPVEPVS